MPEIAWGKTIGPAFKAKIVTISNNLGCDPSHLTSAIAFETGESFSPSIRNKASGATGLIQFMPKTAKALGLSPQLPRARVLLADDNVDMRGYVQGVLAEHFIVEAVANGRDACERALGPGPLRYQVPACPGVEPPALVISRPPSEPAVVMPWVEHYHSRWACSSDEEADRNTLAVVMKRPAPSNVLPSGSPISSTVSTRPSG